MDKKLLEALENISYGLEVLADSLNNKDAAVSETSKAISSGNFGKQLEVISANIKDIKNDTETILKNQQTLMSQSKQVDKDKPKLKFDDKEDLKNGVSTILLIAVGIVAIGAAFKLIGDVDFVSVASLALGITLISLAFERVANLKMDIKQAFIATTVMVMASVGILASSYALSNVKPISASQAATSILIGGVFSVLALGMKNTLGAFKDIKPADAIIASLLLPVVLVSMSLAISQSSKYLSETRSIGLGAFFGSVMTSLVFVAISFGVRKIIKSFSGMDPATIATAAVSIPIMMVAMSYAIYASSGFLSEVSPITMNQFLTSAGIGLIFIGLAFAANRIIKSSEEIKPESIIKIPLLFITMSSAIMASSHILDKTAVVSKEKLITAGLLGVGLGLMTIALAPSIKILSNIPISSIIKGMLVIPLVATAVMVSSHILGVGNYEKYPSIDWVAGSSLSLLTFGLGALGLGLAVAGPQAILFAAGLLAVVGVAGSIVAVSNILSKGSYSNPGMLEWAKSTALLYAAFTPVLMILGTAALVSSVSKVFGVDPWAKAKSSILEVAQTIVDVSYILKSGNYTEGPSKEWASGIAISLGAFTPIYDVLSKNTGLFKSGVSPEDMNRAIMTISTGVVEAANFFADNTVAFREGNYPSENWSRGVGGALGAFAPVFDMLMSKSGFWKSGDSVISDMLNGISGISLGMVSASNIFKGVEWDSYPSEDWVYNVDRSVRGFTELSKYIEQEDVSYWKMTNAASRMSSMSRILNDGIFNNNIDPNYIKNVGRNMIDFTELVKTITNMEDSSLMDKLGGIGNKLTGNDPITSIAKKMITLAGGYDTLANSLVKLGGAMRALNISDPKMLGGITKSIVEESSGSESVGVSANEEAPVSVMTGYDKGSNIDLKDDLKTIIKLLTNIDTSSKSLNDVLISMSNREYGDDSISFSNNLGV